MRTRGQRTDCSFESSDGKPKLGRIIGAKRILLFPLPFLRVRYLFTTGGVTLAEFTRNVLVAAQLRKKRRE